ncbi:MAG: response regulator [Sneathiellaceae bacterium]
MSDDRLRPIMVVDDSDDDFEAMDRALRRGLPLANPILRFEGGEEALDYLFRRPPYDEQHVLPPALILLDLNMPGVDGRAVLKAVKADETTRRIPVVILTTSDDEWDVSNCYAEGASTFIKKPVDLDGFMQAVQVLKDYWLQVALLPKV